MKIKALVAAAAAVVVCFSFSSCNYIGADPETLMSPPKATGELYHIQTTLNKYVNRQINLKYPLRGDNRTAFVLYDIDGDGEKEAVAFYTPVSESGVAPIHINVMDKQDGEWKTTDDKTSTAADIDKVAFADINADGKAELIMGFVMFSTTEKQLNIYSFKNGKLSQKMQETYTEFATCNMVSKDKEDLFVINLKTAEKRADAKLYSFEKDVAVLKGTTMLDGNVSGYARVQVGYLSDGVTAIYADAYKGSSAMITDLIFIQNNMLINPFLDSKTLENQMTLRESTDTCRDINEDGKIEIPFLEYMPGYVLKPMNERMYLTVWKDFDGMKLTDIYKGDMNYKDGYSFEYPQSWIGNITAVKNANNRMRSYKIWDPIQQIETEEILNIRVYTEKEYTKLDKKGLIELDRANSLVYVAKIIQTQGEYALTEPMVKNLFRLIG